MEQPILNTIQLFADAIRHIETRKEGCGPTFTVSLSKNKYSEKSEVTLNCNFYDGKNYSTVSGSSLDSLVAEVLRRLGFQDRELIEVDRIEASLTALEYRP